MLEQLNKISNTIHEGKKDDELFFLDILKSHKEQWFKTSIYRYVNIHGTIYEI